MGDNLMKIAILHVATRNYKYFIEPTTQSVERYFLPNIHKDYFVFTDDVDLKVSVPITTVKVEPKGFPGDTYYRYHYFLKIKEKLQEYDYIYYLDADMKVVDYVNEEVLTDLLGVQHPGFISDKRGTPEDKQVNSTAFVEKENIKQYCCGGFQGGSSKEYLKLSETISKNIDIDDKNNILAVWHDESHFNKYLVDNPPTKILDAGYCAPESAWSVPFSYKIIALDSKETEELKQR